MDYHLVMLASMMGGRKRRGRFRNFWKEETINDIRLRGILR